MMSKMGDEAERAGKEWIVGERWVLELMVEWMDGGGMKKCSVWW